MRVALLGTPGAGKGTQAKLLEKRFGTPQVSTGDILRRAVRNGSQLGRKAKEYMDEGQLVPDEVIIGVVGERLQKPDCQDGFVLDGFPRTVPQAQALLRLLEEQDSRLDGVVRLWVPAEQVMERLSGRRTCRECGTMYHVTMNPPGRDGVCEQCGGELYQRTDDHEETIRARLEVFEREAAPVFEYLKSRGVFWEIDGMGRREDVLRRILEAVQGKD